MVQQIQQQQFQQYEILKSLQQKQMQYSAELTHIQNRIDQNTSNLNNVVNTQLVAAALQQQQHSKMIRSQTVDTGSGTGSASTNQQQQQQQLYQHATSQTNVGQQFKNEFEFAKQPSQPAQQQSVQQMHQSSQPASLVAPIIAPTIPQLQQSSQQPIIYTTGNKLTFYVHVSFKYKIIISDKLFLV